MQFKKIFWNSITCIEALIITNIIRKKEKENANASH